MLTTLILSATSLSLSAQSPTVALSALVPIQSSAAAAGASAQAQQPAGPITSQGGVLATLPHAGVTLESRAMWSVVEAPTQAEITFQHRLDTSGSSGATLSSGPSEFLVELSGVGQTVYLELSAQTFQSPGVTAALMAWDFGNTGVATPMSANTLVGLPITQLTGQPTQVRIVLDSDLVGSGVSVTSVTLKVLPVNDVGVVPMAVSCAPDSAWMEMPQEVFAGRGVSMSMHTGGDPAVFVVGLQSQPTLLPTAGLVPCLLVPSPEIVLFDPGMHLQVALPPALRPLTFYVQGVMVSAGALWTTQGYAVAAF